MLSQAQIKNLLKKYQIPLKKHWGQNFLINQKVINLIIEAAEIKFGDTILEIGPGLGSLTRGLVQTRAKIIAVEKDKGLVKILQECFQDAENLQVIEDDARHLESRNVPRHIPTRYKIVANLPYYLSAPIIRQFLESENPPQLMVLLIQKEVAQRICSQPPRMNLLAVSVQIYAQPKIIGYVSKKSFWPQPEVDGAIIKIIPLVVGRRRGACLPKNVFRLVKAGFSHPRKQLVNNLVKALKIERSAVQKILQNTGLDRQCRAENLSVEQWLKLSQQIKSEYQSLNVKPLKTKNYPWF